MSKRIPFWVALALVVALVAASVPLASAFAAPAGPGLRQDTPASSVLTAEALANLTYESAIAPDGIVTLVGGRYDDAATGVYAVLVTQPVAYGTLDNRDAAAVLVAESGGGSGVFVNLALVLEQEGVPVNVASTLLGDRVDVIDLAIDSDQVTVEMVRQGENDPMCCPTELVRIVFALDDGRLLPVDEIVLGRAPQVFLNTAPAGGYSTAVMPSTPYDDSQPAVSRGAPIHTIVAFGDDNPGTVMVEGKPYIAVYPARDYATRWDAAGDATVSESLAALNRVVAERPDDAGAPIPMLPPPAGVVDLVTQVTYLDGDGYRGVRYIGRVAQDATPVLNDELRYYFQGLTDDGQYLIVAQASISTTVLPNGLEEVPAAVSDASTADYGAYLAAIAAELNELADDQWTPAPGTLDAVVASLTVQRPGPALTPEKLANTSYKSTLAPAGEVRLVDGSYEDGENRISVTLAPEPMASGELDGFEAAAVLIVGNGGGSGSFVSLAVVLDVGGDAINIASTTLGDRVSVSNLAITDEGRIVVDMVQQGPNDPMCCPTLPTTQVYVLAGDQLVMEEETTAAIAATGESGPVSAAVIEPVAYDTSMPPGAQGQPRHFVFAFDGDNPDQAQQLGNGYVAVYPVEEYKQIWAEADDPFVADTLAQIETLLTDRPAAPQPALPVLPPVPAANDLAAQVAYLDLPDGAGVRFVGRFVQDLSPVENAQLRYLFQGLTRDGQYLITASIPVTTSLLPAEPQSLSGAEYERFVQDYIGYLEETTATLDAAAPGDFVPDLDVLDALLESVDVTVARNPLSPRSLANMEYKSEMAEAGSALLQNGIYTETVLPGSASIITVQLVPFPLAYGRLDGEEAAAVLLAENGGGSGIFVNLAVVVNRDGVPVHVASVPLGDRVQVSSLTLEDDLIRVEMLAHGPDDPACCPNQPVTQRYRWQDTQLVLDDGAHDETADGSPLAGTAWQWLLTINSDEAVTVPAVTGQYTLVFHGDGTLRATSDCADLSGSYSTGEDAALAIDLKTSTAASCAAGSQHLDYVFDLMAAASYEMAEGKLFVLKEYGGIMEFAPAP